jgi:glycosyltransferase involved in cell wall biosynthesis
LHSWEWTTLLWKVATKVNKVLRNISDRLFVHWDKLRKEVIEKYNIPEKKVFSIVHWNYNFFKDVFSKWWEIEKNTFLFFWRIVDYKWLDLLLDSLFIVKEKVPDFKLIIAWPGDLAKYQENIERLKDNLEIFNYNIEPEEVYIYFEKSEFVVLPYRDATWSWVIPVAYAFSKPVLVTNVWELPSVVKNNITWIITEKNNIAKLAENIIFMLENKQKIIEMWKKWREFSDRELWWDGIVKKVYNL